MQPTLAQVTLSGSSDYWSFSTKHVVMAAMVAITDEIEVVIRKYIPPTEEEQLPAPIPIPDDHVNTGSVAPEAGASAPMSGDGKPGLETAPERSDFGGSSVPHPEVVAPDEVDLLSGEDIDPHEVPESTEALPYDPAEPTLVLPPAEAAQQPQPASEPAPPAPVEEPLNLATPVQETPADTSPPPAAPGW